MFSILKKLFLILLIIFTSKVSFSSETNLIKSLSNTGNHKIFIRILESSPLFLSLVNNTVSSTIYAPTDKAFALMPDSFMREINNNNIKYTTKIILTHIFSGNSLETNKNEGLVLSLDGSLYYTYEVAFSFFDFSYAATITIFLLVILAIISLAQFVFFDKRIHYR